jgi:hypothetical protein
LNLTPFARSQANCFSHASRFGIVRDVVNRSRLRRRVSSYPELARILWPYGSKNRPCPFFPVSSHKVR